MVVVAVVATAVTAGKEGGSLFLTVGVVLDMALG
jgi:hypothetical protein